LQDLGSSKEEWLTKKPKILFTTRSLRSLEDTEITEKIPETWVFFSVLCVLVVKAFDLD
jgi:hypothetical protein